MAPLQPTFQPGALVADGRFRVVRFLAQGGMGEVYEPDDLQLGERGIAVSRSSSSIRRVPGRSPSRRWRPQPLVARPSRNDRGAKRGRP